jgi:hypothetical protein
MRSQKALRLAGLAIMASLAGISSVTAQTGADRVMAQAVASEYGRCTILDIGLNLPLRSIATFPQESGDQVLIRLQPIGGPIPGTAGIRETTPGPRSASARIRLIEYEANATSGPTVTIYFSTAVFFRIGQSPDFQHLYVAISAGAPDPRCVPESPMDQPILRGSAAPVAPETLPSGDASALLDEARAAITRRDYETAIRLLTRMIEEPETLASADARELLGIARERNGQLAHAKAEYEEYLRRYPSGEGANRVRQRLSALLRSALDRQVSARANAANSGRIAGAGAATSGTEWHLRGSISEYLFYDKMKTIVDDDFANVVIDNGFTTLQSELMSALDADAGFETPGMQARFRIAAAHSKNFLNSDRDRTRIAQMFFEASDRDRTLLARIGRQYRSVGGIIGRFDGLLIGYQPWEHIRTEFVAGFPVDSSRSPLFPTYRRAVGASIAYLNGPWNADIYTLRQTDHGILDRQSVGAEFRYVEAKGSVIGMIDYDLHFQQINAAIASGSITFASQTMFNISFDYRSAPILRTSNALIGQSATTLEALLATYSLDEIHQLALDRTAKSTSLLISVTQPISQRFSLGLDATMWTLSSMPDSGGVAAIPSTGTEYYYAAHVIGTGLLMDGDLMALNLGYADSYNANRYMLDLNTRFPIPRRLRLGPRLFTAYRETTDQDSTRYTIRPTMRLNLRLFSDLELEFEGGAEWEDHSLSDSSIRTWNLVTNFGIRWIF